MEYVIVGLLAALLVVELGRVLLFTRAERRSLIGRTIEVHTCRPDDQTIQGVLIAQRHDLWALGEATYRHATGDQPIGDEVVYVRPEHVAWWSEK